VSFSAQETELYDWLRSSLPRWFFEDDEDAQEIWGAIVKGSQPTRAQADQWLEATYILTAEDIWLDQHARDRGTFRQSGESDDVLRDRLRTVEDAVTPPALKAAVDSVLAAAGVAGTCALVELRRDRGYFGRWDPLTGTGGTFGEAATALFTPDVAFTFPPLQAGGSSGEPFDFALVITGSADPADDSPVNSYDFMITGLDGEAVKYADPGLTTGPDPTTAWEVHRYVDGTTSLLTASVEALPPTGAGRKKAYLSRGWRMGSSGRPSSLIVILPYGTDAATALAVAEALRRKAAGGFRRYVERRTSP
jgi:hypothetical protein